MRISSTAKVYLLVPLLAGYAILGWNLLHWQSADLARFLWFLAGASLASLVNIEVPGIAGPLSVQFAFLLLCTARLTRPEVLVIASLSTPLHWLTASRRRVRVMPIVCGVASSALAVTACYLAYRGLENGGAGSPLLMAATACVFFFVDTAASALMAARMEGKDFGKLWRESYFWTFPHYLASGGVAGLLTMTDGRAGWDMMLVVLPVMYWMYHSYRLYLQRLDQEQRRHQELSSLHLRTIEALSVAIGGKDPSKHGRPHRASIYAVEAGRRLGLSERELEALHSAAMLRDIGTLAVPEHIFSKPGMLTDAEFEKVKIHAAAGAEIMEQIDFPYPVAPIVRSHHEKWDGTGYPAGLKGEQIPIGARILAVADCLDALRSDRQHRHALSLEQAMAQIQSERGTSFDPTVVDVFAKCYRELERLVAGTANVSLARSLTSRPAISEVSQSAATNDTLSPIAAARQEVRQLFDLAQVLGTSLSMNETLSEVSLRVRRICAYDSIAIYIRRDEFLQPEYTSGEDSKFFGSLKIPLGQGISGWVAEHRKPVLNGNPSAESGLDLSSQTTSLQSALAIPLEGLDGITGVLTVYAREKDAFTNDHLRILSAISTKMALSIENALKYRQAEDSATTDALTELPNARSLFLRLEAELAHAVRRNQQLALMVCDLNGFKKINDQFGHMEGNRVLRAVGRGLKLQCREDDFVARMGGDEFVIVLSNCRDESIAGKVDQFRRAVAEAGREAVGVLTLGMSVGVACYPNDGVTVEALLVEADRRMYASKQQGENSGSAVRM